MYQGKNPSALRSQQWLTDSLLCLMTEKPFAQITISEICKNADVSRQTFYNFFETKEDILRFNIRKKCEEQFAKFTEIPTMQETVDLIAELLEENRKPLSDLVQNNLDSILFSEMVKCVNLFAEKFVLKGDEDSSFSYRVVLLSGALANLLVYWFREEEPISTTELTQLLVGFLSGELYEFGKR
ncbi:MAG: TetR/AcrR family transcriptional regulator [Candidatus Fimenecus sp.]